ncbi:hypothetical protein POF51_22520 [Brevibacillus sp. AG]|uniref:hypothetical protein n=1 Tax=Brevibacillus sp. AG TaxID=3020891 RepID=UPI00232B061C|nr:hypothetical protein [Brevibacillus sp. AG]MDC0763504.1 hypothetical protein [Brevibacillus sp. AG]
MFEDIGNGKMMLFLDNQGSPDIEFVDVAVGAAEVIADNAVGFVPGKKTYRMLGTIVDALNGNLRVYPRNVMVNAINMWKQSRKGALGEAGHPDSYVDSEGKLSWRSKIENQVIKILDIHLPNEKGNVFFDFQTLDTAKGKDLQAILDAGGQIGCSMRAGGKGKAGNLNGKQVTVATFIDLFAFDTLFDPAVKSTLGSVTPLTDNQIESVISGSTEAVTDAVDPILSRVSEAFSVEDMTALKKEIDQMSLTALERRAIESAYNQKWWDLMDELRAKEMQTEIQQNKIGFTDNQKGDENLMYTFEQLSKMTDSELKKIKQETPEVGAMCDAILGHRQAEQQAKELQAFKDAEEKRQATEAAEAFMDSDEVKGKLQKLPAHIQETVRGRVDLTNRDTALKTFNDSYDFAISMVAEDKLAAMGFKRDQQFTDNQASVNGVQVGETRQGWREFTDKLAEATDDQYRMFQGIEDENLKKLNKPILDRLMREFDKANAAGLATFADDFSTSTNTSTVLNGVAFQRQIIEQAFQRLVALQFVQVQTFSGEFMEIPRETYERVNNLPLNNGEQNKMAKATLSLDYLHVAAVARKLAAEITLEAKKRLQSGPLNYEILSRLNYHLSEDLKRDTSLRLHNEMLSSSDEYGATRITGEDSEISGDRRTVTFLRGGQKGSLTAKVKATPIVRPRVTHYWTSAGKQSVTENQIVIRVGGNPVDLSGAIIDYENGTVTFATPLAAGTLSNDYTMATNVALFDLTVPSGIAAEKYFNNLIHIIGQQKAIMGGDPRFYSPNFMLMSEAVSNEVSQAELFSNLFQKNGNDLQPNGYVGRVKAIDAFEHNEPWQGLDSRILLGQRLATKYGIGTSVSVQGPFPTRDGDGELTGGDELYLYMDDALNTPVKQVYRTIKLYKS